MLGKYASHFVKLLNVPTWPWKAECVILPLDAIENEEKIMHSLLFIIRWPWAICLSLFLLILTYPRYFRIKNTKSKFSFQLFNLEEKKNNAKKKKNQINCFYFHIYLNWITLGYMNVKTSFVLKKKDNKKKRN